MTEEGSDDGLIRAVLKGEADAFRAMYRRHNPAIYRVALAFTGGSEADAQDVVQETWMRAVRALPRFEGRSSLATWLRAIAARCAAERYRKSRRETHGTSPEDRPDPARSSVATRLDLERTVAEMPPGFRTVLLLHDVEGYRHADIGELLGISTGTSKSQLSRARKWVRTALGEDYDQS